MTIKPVAWTNEAQLGFVADTKWSGIPMAMWGKRQCYAQPDIALCRHDEAMAEIDGLTKERDAAFAMSRCECGTDEACANLVAKDAEIERLQAENATLRQQLAEALLAIWREGTFETTGDEAAQAALDHQAEGLDAAAIIEAWLTALTISESKDNG